MKKIKAHCGIGLAGATYDEDFEFDDDIPDDEISNEINLLPCPFCGGEAVLKRDRIGLYCVKCTNCGCMTTFQFDFGEGEEVSKSKAAEVWNRRVGEQNE